MSPSDDLEVLRRHVKTLAGEADLDLARRYELRRSHSREMLLPYRRLRKAAGRILRRLGLRRTPPPEPWLPALNRHANGDQATALVIWAVGTDRETLRAACRSIEKLQAGLPDLAPVLITDVADFAFFSRLGWLVEFVPALSAPAEGYAARKLRYLAWLYSAAPVLPASADLAASIQTEALAPPAGLPST